MQPLSPFIWAQFPLSRRCVPLGLMGSWTLASSQPAALPLCAPSIKLRVGFHPASQFSFVSPFWHRGLLISLSRDVNEAANIC